MRMSICQPSGLWVMSSVFVARSGAFGWHNIFAIKLLKGDVFISVDQRIINKCYILHIFSPCRFFMWLGLQQSKQWHWCCGMKCDLFVHCVGTHWPTGLNRVTNGLQSYDSVFSTASAPCCNCYSTCRSAISSATHFIQSVCFHCVMLIFRWQGALASPLRLW